MLVCILRQIPTTCPVHLAVLVDIEHPRWLLSSVCCNGSSATFSKLYYTCFYLATSFVSVKGHYEAINKNYKNGNPVLLYEGALPHIS
jgi:hypothetical protein